MDAEAAQTSSACACETFYDKTTHPLLGTFLTKSDTPSLGHVARAVPETAAAGALESSARGEPTDHPFATMVCCMRIVVYMDHGGLH